MLLPAQGNHKSSVSYINGFASARYGEPLQYHSFHPFASHSLLTRCTDGKMSIGWTTAAPPRSDRKQKQYAFSWIAAFSSGTSTSNSEFELRINGALAGTFSVEKGTRNVRWLPAPAYQQCLLSFELVSMDHVDDCFGYMTLYVPSSLCGGKALEIDMCGKSLQTRDWCMVFTRSLAADVTASVVPSVVLDNSVRCREVLLCVESPQPLATGQVYINGKAYQKISTGFMQKPDEKNGKLISVLIPESETGSQLDIEIRFPDLMLKKSVNVPAVTIREVYMLPHSHNDIGYTDIQPNILQLQLDNFTEALRLIAASDTMPQGCRYKWNSEIMWPLEVFLQTAPASDVAAMLQAIREGSIGVNGTYSNQMTGNCMPEELMRLTETCRKLRDQYGIKVQSAMISDIPGLSWSMVQALHSSGIKYLSSGPNPFDRIGHSTKAFGDKPFYWTAPSGVEKILVWVAGTGYAMFHQNNTIAGFHNFKYKLFEYLGSLSEAAYPYDMVQMRVALYSDNGPNDSTLSRYVYEWNQRYEAPKLVIATTDEMFTTFEKRYAGQIPEYSGDYTPYWEDGALSTAAEFGMNRRNAEKLVQLETAYAMLNPAGYQAGQFYNAWKYITLFSEHTWGSAQSISAPDLENVQQQWQYKKRYALLADSMVRLIEQALFPQSAGLAFSVINTLSFQRSEVVVTRLPANCSDVFVFDDKGKEVASQLLHHNRFAFMADSIPALGTKTYTLKPRSTARSLAVLRGCILETPAFRLRVDTITGALKSLVEIQRAKEWVDSTGMNAYIYVSGTSPENSQWSTFQQANILSSGPLIYEMEVQMAAPGATSLTSTYTVPLDESGIHIKNTISKKAIRSKEAVYFQFPFAIDHAVNRFDAGWGVYGPDSNQLPGSNCDFFYAMRWVDAFNDSMGITWVLHETPLFETESITDETPHNMGPEGWRTNAMSSSRFYSYAMNNYWHTNFKADQEGNAVFCYDLKPHAQYLQSESYRYSMQCAMPLLVLFSDDQKAMPSVISLSDNDILVTMLRPDDNGTGFMVRLFNSSDEIRWLWPEWFAHISNEVYFSNNLGDKLQRFDQEMLPIGPMSTMTFFVPFP